MSSPELRLLVITPSRGRPKSIARLLDAIHATRRIETHLHVGVDEDDTELGNYQKVFDHAAREGDVLEPGPRTGLAGWTDRIAVRRAGEYPFLASLGDDHIPFTPGWDIALVRGILEMGGTGFTYPWDNTREDIPEAVVLSSNIVQALGYMCPPVLKHWYIDNVWNDLGWGAGCIRHLRAVTVDHVHPATGKSRADQTTADSAGEFGTDREAYYEWRRTQMPDDVLKIVKLREKPEDSTLQSPVKLA